MSIVNQIAAFGRDAGSGLVSGMDKYIRNKQIAQRNELAKHGYDIQDKRYENEMARYGQEQKEKAAAAEREAVQSGLKAVLSMPEELRGQGYAGYLEGLRASGAQDVDLMPQTYDPEAIYRMAGKFGVPMVKTDDQPSPYGKINPKDFTPESLAAFQTSGDYSQLRQSPVSQASKGTPKAFQPEQYTDAAGNVKWGIPTFDPATNSVAMKPLDGMAPVEEEKPLSPTVQKILDESQSQYFDSDRKAREYEVLAGDIESMSGQFGGGLEAKWTEQYKEMTGNQDAITDLRRRFYGVRASQAVSNLPPGVASDKDIALALSGFPDEKANAQQVSSFMRGMAKLERLKAEFHSFKSQKLSRDGNTKNMIAEWKEYADELELYGDSGPRPGDVVDGFRFKGGDPGDQNNWEQQ